MFSFTHTSAQAPGKNAKGERGRDRETVVPTPSTEQKIKTGEKKTVCKWHKAANRHRDTQSYTHKAKTHTENGVGKNVTLASKHTCIFFVERRAGCKC